MTHLRKAHAVRFMNVAAVNPDDTWANQCRQRRRPANHVVGGAERAALPDEDLAGTDQLVDDTGFMFRPSR
jgi:hypothetical protein